MSDISRAVTVYDLSFSCISDAGDGTVSRASVNTALFTIVNFLPLITLLLNPYATRDYVTALV